jgi:hypothetical protein
MNTTEHGLKKPSKNELSEEEAKTLIQAMVIGADMQQIQEMMTQWSSSKQLQGWQLAAEYFQECANFNPNLEKGRSIARLQLLFRNSVQIQDFKTCLAVQKEINKMMRLYVR